MVKTAWLWRAATYGIATIMTLFGLTSVASAQTISVTGPGSTNRITTTTTDNCTVTNNNNVSATENNSQTAVSGDSTSSGNTVSSLPWTGWNTLDPATAQADGQSYTAWFNGVINWVSNRSSGAGWNSNDSNLSWTPSGSDWNAFDPVSWQANGQSFGNWYNALQAYMNSNSSSWMLTWTGSGDNTGSLGTTTGSATNTNSANFSININNAARAVAGTNSCGQSNYTPPPSTGGMGAGGSWTAPTVSHSLAAVSGGQGSGSGEGYSYSPTYYPHSSYHASAPVSKPAAPAPSVVQTTPVTPPPAQTVTPSAPQGNSISTTGPGSTNTISTTTTSNYQVTNNNNVSASSSNFQTAQTGSSTSNGNTVASGSGTGAATNGNASGTDVGVDN